MSSTHAFRLCAFGCNILASASDPQSHAILQRYVFPSVPRTSWAVDQPDVSLHIHSVADTFQLAVDGTVVASAHGAIALVPDIIRVLDEAVIQRLTSLTGLRAIHAGVVRLGTRALLLPGATHAGKSSLVAELLRRGATYFSDEYALIDGDGWVLPYPRPLLLRNGGPDQSPSLPEDCNACFGETRAPVGWILSLAYQPTSAWSVAAISQSEALLMLLRNTPHALVESTDMVEVFQRAVAGAACYAGQRPDVGHAVDQILQLVGNFA